MSDREAMKLALEPDAIARAVEAAVKECVTICERQRVKILKNPTDPSWTEHLAEVQSAIKQRFGVEMGYPALAEPEPEPVAWMYVNTEGECEQIEYGTPSIDDDSITLLYAAPPKPPAKPEPITEDALREWLDAQDRDLWQRRADEAFLKEYEKRHGKPEPATYEQVYEAYAVDGMDNWLDYRVGWLAAERFHGIGGSKT